MLRGLRVSARVGGLMRRRRLATVAQNPKEDYQRDEEDVDEKVGIVDDFEKGTRGPLREDDRKRKEEVYEHGGFSEVKPMFLGDENKSEEVEDSRRDFQTSFVRRAFRQQPPNSSAPSKDSRREMISHRASEMTRRILAGLTTLRAPETAAESSWLMFRFGTDLFYIKS
jgi:hypothetical protein